MNNLRLHTAAWVFGIACCVTAAAEFCLLHDTKYCFWSLASIGASIWFTERMARWIGYYFDEADRQACGRAATR